MKLSFEVTDEQAKQLGQQMPWGAGKRLWQAILDDILDLFKEHPPDLVIGLIISNRAKPRDVLPSLGAAAAQVKKEGQQ